ncbi:MAG: cytochrome c oxidase assembly protein, partial [Acidimicrobiia bacterium]
MLSAGLTGSVVAHSGEPLAPHDLWSAWNLHPLVVLGLVVAAGAYHRGRRRHGGPRAGAWRGWCFAAGLVAVAVALVSPLDALSASLAS